MGEERINRVKIEDLPQPEQELTPEEAQHVKGGIGLGGDDAAAREMELKQGGDALKTEQSNKRGGDSASREEVDKKL